MKKLSALFLALLLALSLSACGGGGEDAGAQAVVRCGLSSAWDSLMPYNSPSGSNYSRIIYDKIYDRLAYVHADGTLDPRGAESWESADGGYAVLFHLDQGAAFHDGTPVTAEHWADTIALLTDPDCPTLGRAAFSVLAGTDDNGAAVEGEALGAEAVDDYTLRLTFKTPTTPEDFLLDRNREYYVLPTHLLEGVEPSQLMDLELWDKPIGSGPCKFVSETPGSQLVLEANKDYQLGAPGFDQLVIRVIDKSNLLTSLIAGDLDYYAFGGNVTVIGTRPDGDPWRVAVKDPRNTDGYLCILELEDVTLSTSGGYERYFEEDGVRYHHIIDPKTGYPADSGLLSVTVVTANHVLADALSTALFVAGPEEALDFWRSRDDFELVLCTDDSRIIVTQGLEDAFQLYDQDGGYTYEIARR